MKVAFPGRKVSKRENSIETTGPSDPVPMLSKHIKLSKNVEF